MLQIKICSICGKKFMSKNGTEICSAVCAMERKHKQDSLSNYRRYNHCANIERICPICNKTFSVAGYRKYCCSECASIARKKNQVEYNKEYYLQNKDKILSHIKENKKKNKETYSD